MNNRLSYQDNTENVDRMWALIHARDAHLKTLTPTGRAAVQNAHTTCDACGNDTPVAVLCHSCGNWLNEAANPDFDAAKEAVVQQDADIAAAA